MAKVIKLQVNGPDLRYRFSLGNGLIFTDDGNVINRWGTECFDSLLVFAERLGHDTSDMKLKLDEWVKTGRIS